MKNIDYSFINHSKNQTPEKERNSIHHNKLFIIIDGVGRDYLRAKATNLAYNVIQETFFRTLEKNNSPGDAILSSLKKANSVILEERLKINEKMAASVCILYIEGRIMYFSHLGDSRIYSFQDNELNQLTRDHTLREEDPFAEKRYDDPRALQALIKGLGIHEEPDIYIKKYPLEKKGMVILTTERLTERISNRDFQWLSKKFNNPKKLENSIVELYHRKGGDEGFTLGIIKYGVIPKWVRGILSVYLASFLIIIALISGYFIIYNNDVDITEESPALNEPVVVEDITGNTPVLEEQKTPDSPQAKKRSVVRQPIIVDKGKDTSVIDQPGSSDTESINEMISEVHNFLDEWTTAWELSAGSKGSINYYMSFYSDDFKSGNLDKNEWASDKSGKNRRKKWIRVEVSNIKIFKPDKDGRVKVRFSQDYRSSNYSVVSRKVLLLKKEDNKWIIVSEKSN
jgi:PPM family protein phosphatase